MIEFTCSKCGSLLRVPDEALGKAAKCPNCQNVEDVRPQNARPPEIAPEPPFTAPPSEVFGIPRDVSRPKNDFEAKFRDSGNPYQPPAYAPEEKTSVSDRTVESGEFVHTKITIMDILSRMWNTLSNRFDRVLLALLICAGIYLFGYGIVVAINVTMSILENTGAVDMILTQVVTQFNGMILGLVLLYLTFGSIRFWLDISRGGKGEFRMLFLPPIPALYLLLMYIIQYVIFLVPASILGGIPLAMGLVRLFEGGLPFNFGQNAPPSFDPLAIGLIILGGAIFCLVWFVVQAFIGCSYAFYLDDEKKNLGIFSSIGHAFRFGRGNRISIFIALIANTIIIVACSLITCWITFGGFFAMLQAAFYATVYLSLTGQPFAFTQTGNAPYGNPPTRNDRETGVRKEDDEDERAKQRLDAY